MKSFLNEFKNFAIRGNVIDMAIGIIIGTAFNKIVSSLVNDILMPILGAGMGKVSLSELTLQISELITIKYGLFLQQIVDFTIIAFVAFVIIKSINTLKTQAEDTRNPQVETPKEIALLSEIRDLLKK